VLPSGSRSTRTTPWVRTRRPAYACWDSASCPSVTFVLPPQPAEASVAAAIRSGKYGRTQRVHTLNIWRAARLVPHGKAFADETWMLSLVDGGDR